MAKPRIAVIISSTRQARFADKGEILLYDAPLAADHAAGVAIAIGAALGHCRPPGNAPEQRHRVAARSHRSGISAVMQRCCNVTQITFAGNRIG